MNWLLLAAALQLCLFVSFVAFFFTSEHQKQGELLDMQGELHRLRAENQQQGRQLMHASSRVLKYVDPEATAEDSTGAELADDDRVTSRTRDAAPMIVPNRRHGGREVVECRSSSQLLVAISKFGH